MPRFAEPLELRTWCAAAAAGVAERRTTIAGEHGASVDAEAIWVHIDLETRRPAPFPPAFLAAYAESAGGRRPRTKLRHRPQPPPDASRSEWTFTAADVDIAAHVNNAVYWRLLEEAMGGGVPPERESTLEAEYRAGTGAGPVSVARDGGQLWVIDGSGTLAATLSHAPGGQTPA